MPNGIASETAPPTSLNTRECCGAYSFILSTVGLRAIVTFSAERPWRVLQPPASETFHAPDLVAELGELGLIDRIELELLLRFNQDASVEATAPEDDGHLDVGILIQNVLYAWFSAASMGT